MTCNCPLWSLICGTENKGQTSLKMGDGKDKGTGREKGQRADFYIQFIQFTSNEATLSFQSWDLCHQVTLMGQADRAPTDSNQHQACGRGKIQLKFPHSPLDKESVICSLQVRRFLQSGEFTSHSPKGLDGIP